MLSSAVETDVLSDEEYLAYQAQLEDEHPEATIATGNTVAGLADISSLPF